MPAPINTLKAALANGDPQLGCWMGLASDYVAEITANAGFDWCLVDGEHAPNDLSSILSQIRVIEASSSQAVARVPVGEPWLIKQYLDAGVQSILVPIVESGEQARELVRAVRYPPRGIRGVGAAVARASGFNAIPDYLATADDQVCLLLQVENRAGLDALDDILGVDGVDGVFIGPADLSADLGYLGNAGADEVRHAIEDALRRIVASGKSAGILAPDPEDAHRALSLGATFIGTAIDVTHYAASIRDTARRSQAMKSA